MPAVSLKTSITTPVSRLVQGSLYKFKDKDIDGKPLTTKKGLARVEYFFAVAIPKEPGQTHWSQKPASWDAPGSPFAGKPYWGEEIWRVGHTAFPGIASRPDFSWKVEDGDSQIPNKKNNRPCDNEGWVGHWILKFKSGTAPAMYQADATAPSGWAPIAQEGFIKNGYWIQVMGNVDSNDSEQQPGVYLNHQMVALRGYGQEIITGPSVAEAGFGGGMLPAGASAIPLASSNPLPAAAPAIPAPPSAPAAIPAPTAYAPAPPVAPQPVPVAPNPQFLQVPAAPVPPPAVPVAPVPVAAIPIAPVAPTPPIATTSPSRTMTAKAGGASYETFIAANWDDARMIAEGYMTI